MKPKLIFENESLAYKQLMILGAISYKVKGNEITGIDAKGKKIQTVIIKKNEI